MNDIKTYDPADAFAKVKDKIKNEFSALVPDEMWQKMVQDTVDKFIKEEIPALVKGMLLERFKECIQNYITTIENEKDWNGYVQQYTHDMLKKIFTENAGDMLKNMFDLEISNVLNMLRTRSY